MHNSTSSRRLLRALLFFLFTSFSTFSIRAQTALTAGDIAFVGWNAYDDGTNGTTNDDQIAFVLLKDIAANTVIYFTDFGWTNQGRFQRANPCGANTGSASDGIIKWTASQNLSCGTLIWVKTKYLTSASLTNSGSVAGIYKTFSTANNTPPASYPNYVSVPTSGDQIFAFQVASGNVAALSSGTITGPTLIAALNTKIIWDTDLDECTQTIGQSLLPAALASAAIYIPSANGSDLSGRINARYTCNGNTTASPGVMRASMTNSTNWQYNQTNTSAGVYNFGSFGCTFTCSAATPDISVQPANVTTCDTRSAAFTITATNTTGYQWQISTNGGSSYSNLSNGGVYSNVTTANLSISNATGLDGMFYRCVVSNASSSINSNGAKLTVNRFVSQPSNMTACSACAAGFTVSARGLGLTYQWQISNDNGATFSNITNGGVYSGATTKTLAISSANGLNAKQYRCVLGGCTSPITSSAGILTVSGSAQTTLTQGDIAVVAYNTSDDQTNGTTQDDEIVFVLLKDIVAGTEISLTDYGWRSDTQAFLTSCSAGIIKWIAGSNLTCGTQVKVKSKYLLEASTGVVIPIETNAGDPTLYISLSALDVVFAFQGLRTSPTLLYGLHMNAWTASVTSCVGAGTSALPTVLNVTGLNVALGRDGTAGKDWTSANYNCTNVNATPTSLRSSVSTGTNWTKNANSVSLPICTFTCNSGAPQITAQPTNVTTCDGRTASFTVTAAGTNTFKWQIFNGSTWDYLTNNAVYSNVTTNTLTINNATGLDGKLYRCEVTNAVTFVNSNSAILTVNRFRNQPVNMTTCTGCQAVFSVVASGNGLTYQWQESSNGGSTFSNITNGGVYSGVTGNILRISNVTSPTNLTGRQYRVVLGGCANPINSESKILTVSATAATSIVAGDITFIGYGTNDDGVDGITQDDEFAFILLKDINAGTEISFTDFGWRSDANAFQESNPACNPAGGATGDGILKWIASSNLTCGTQVSIKSKYTLQASTGVAYGVQPILNTTNVFLSFSTVGDQIFAFTGTYASPTLIAGLSMRAWDATLTNCEQTSNKSVKPSALNGFVVEFTSASANLYAAYKCSAPTKDLPATVRTATQNTANWDVSNTTAFTFPLVCSFCCSASFTITAQPANQSVCAGSGASFTVTTSPTGQAFQWQVNTGSGFANIPVGAPYSGITTNSLSISSASGTMNTYQYRCVITDLCGSTNSNAATLSVFLIDQPSSVSPSAAANVNYPNAISLTATCPVNTTAVWYLVSGGGTSIGTGSPFNYTPTNAGNYQFYASCKMAQAPLCESATRIATGMVSYCSNSVTALPNYSSNSLTIKALTSITVNNQITNTSNITYQGGTFIQLNPGFQVDQGNVFMAKMGGCN